MQAMIRHASDTADCCRNPRNHLYRGGRHVLCQVSVLCDQNIERIAHRVEKPDFRVDEQDMGTMEASPVPTEKIGVVISTAIIQKTVSMGNEARNSFPAMGSTYPGARIKS